jgi:integrase
MNFETAATQYLLELETGSNPCRPSTLGAYRSTLRTHLTPRFGSMGLSELAGQNNRVLRDLVKELRAKYRPASIRLIVTLFKSVMDSPRDNNGVRLFKSEWNNDFIDLPAIVPAEQHAPMITTKELNAVVAGHSDSLLFAVLAGTGMRVGECLTLRAADWDRKAGILFVRAGKTASAVREIDLTQALNHRMQSGIPADQDRLFPNSMTFYRSRAEGVTGFAHSFRRFRLTHLRRMGAPEDLLRFWLGHASQSVSDRYSRIRCDREFRREQVEKAGLGFGL